MHSRKLIVLSSMFLAGIALPFYGCSDDTSGEVITSGAGGSTQAVGGTSGVAGKGGSGGTTSGGSGGTGVAGKGGGSTGGSSTGGAAGTSTGGAGGSTGGSGDVGGNNAGGSGDVGGNNAGGSGDVGGNNAGGAGGAAAMVTDGNIVATMQSSDNGEIAEAKDVTMVKTTTPDVLKFAAMMDIDHSKDLSDLMAVATTANITPQPDADSMAIDMSTKSDEASWVTATGPTFDVLYAAAQVKAHQTTLDLIKNKLLHSVTNMTLKTYLTNAQALVEAHLTAAQQLQAKVGGAGGGAGAGGSAGGGGAGGTGGNP